MKPNVAFALINLLSALLIAGVNIPLVKGKINMNHLYGVRIKKSMASEEIGLPSMHTAANNLPCGLFLWDWSN